MQIKRKQNFILGVNYWPRKKAMYWWRDFDENEVNREFKEIAGYGLNTIRFFLDWEYFQPHPSKINNQAIKNLEKVFDIAKKYSLKTIPTLMTGHMSCQNLVPFWALDTKKKHKLLSYSNNTWYPYSIKNIYEDKFMIQAEKFFIKNIVKKFAQRKEILMWDISNESLHLYMPADAKKKRGSDSKILQKWITLMSKEIKKYDKKHPVTYSAEVYEFYEKRNNKGKRESNNEVISLHYFPEVDWGKTLKSEKVIYKKEPPVSLGNKKPVLLEEFGKAMAPKNSKSSKHIRDKCIEQMLAREEDVAKMYKDILKRFYKMGAIGVIAWKFSDYGSSFHKTPPFDESPQEKYFGITRADGSIKPCGKVMVKFGKQLKKDIGNNNYNEIK